MNKRLIISVLCAFLMPILRGQNPVVTSKSPVKTPTTTTRKTNVNLVVNPSFEIPADSTKSLQLDNPIEAALGWNSPNKSEARFFTSTKTDVVYDVYGSSWTFKARSGQNVAGLNVYGINSLAKTELRDYIQGSLSEPLTVGKKYYFAFWVHYHCEGANNIGIAFLPRKLQIDSLGRLPLKAAAYQVQVNNYSETTPWALVVDSFIAQRPFQNFIIGNFFSNDSTKLQSNKYRHHFAYIDDVFVMEAKHDVMPEDKKIADWSKNEKVFVPKVLNRVQFKFNSAEFEPESFVQLDEAVSIMKDIPNIRILIKGHTSSDGDTASNLKLSQKRAEAVMNYLIVKGIDSARLTSQGLGEKQLLLAEDTEENRKINRRVEFEILEK